jgi:hypothetical protein
VRVGRISTRRITFEHVQGRRTGQTETVPREEFHVRFYRLDLREGTAGRWAGGCP